MKYIKIGYILLMLLLTNLTFCQEADNTYHSCIDSLPLLPGVPLDQYIEKYGLEVSDEVAYEGRRAWVSMQYFHNVFDSIPDPYFLESVRIVKSPTDSNTDEILHYFFLLGFEDLEDISSFLGLLFTNYYSCLPELKSFADKPFFGEWNVLKDGYILTFSLEDPGWYQFRIKVELLKD